MIMKVSTRLVARAMHAASSKKALINKKMYEEYMSRDEVIMVVLHQSMNNFENNDVCPPASHQPRHSGLRASASSL